MFSYEMSTMKEKCFMETLVVCFGGACSWLRCMSFWASWLGMESD